MLFGVQLDRFQQFSKRFTCDRGTTVVSHINSSNVYEHDYSSGDTLPHASYTELLISTVEMSALLSVVLDLNLYPLRGK